MKNQDSTPNNQVSKSIDFTKKIETNSARKSLYVEYNPKKPKMVPYGNITRDSIQIDDNNYIVHKEYLCNNEGLKKQKVRTFNRKVEHLRKIKCMTQAKKNNLTVNRSFHTSWEKKIDNNKFFDWERSYDDRNNFEKILDVRAVSKRNDSIQSWEK